MMKEVNQDIKSLYKNSLLLPGVYDLAESLIQELTEYKGLSKETVQQLQEGSKDLLNEEWEKRKSVVDFYAETEHYLYDLSLFHSKYGACKPIISTLGFARIKGLSRILDFGAGIGSAGIIFAKDGLEVTLAEVSDLLLGFATWRFKRRNLEAKFINLLKEDLPKDTFELVISTDVFEHLRDPQGEIEKIHRSMKDGGYLFFDIATEQKDSRLMHISTAKDILPFVRSRGFRKVPIDTGGLHCYQKVNRPKVINYLIGQYDAYVYYPLRWFLLEILKKMHIKPEVGEILTGKRRDKGAKIERYSLFGRLTRNVYRKLSSSLRLRIAWGRFNNRLSSWREIYQNLDFPSIINLGLSSACQARCIFCPIKTNRWIKPVDMPVSLAKKIIDEAYGENFQGKFRWSETGEALLHKNFIPIMEYFRLRLPENESCLVSNMDRLDKEMAKRLLGFKLSELHLNIDGASKETYEYVKRGLSFERMKRNLRDFIEVRDQMSSPCVIHISILTAKRYLTQVEGKPSPFDDDDSKEVIDYWRPLLRESDSIRIVDFADWWAFQEKVKRPKIYPCTYFSRAVDECFIAPNGIMYPCCLDYKAQVTLGNLNQNTIREIWNSPKRLGILRLLEQGKFKEIGEPCKYCLT